MYNGWLIYLTTIKVKSSSDEIWKSFIVTLWQWAIYVNPLREWVPEFAEIVCILDELKSFSYNNKCGMLRYLIVEYKIRQKMIRPQGHKT